MIFSFAENYIEGLWVQYAIVPGRRSKVKSFRVEGTKRNHIENPYLQPMQAYTYILLCSNNQYYTGSTKKPLNKRVAEHQRGEGANFTRKHLPVKLVYFEEFQRIEEAFKREKQIQGWTRKKKEALIKGESNQLKKLSKKDFGN